MNRTDVALQLSWHELAKTYSTRPVYDQLAGELHSGEVLAVRGPNGAGKSTFLRLLCGLERPSAGTIRYQWQGQTYSPNTMRPWIGFVGPDVALYRELSAIEHLQFLAKARGLAADQVYWRELLAQVGLAGREAERVAHFSSGMALRLKYAIALLAKPPVLLLDEPTAMFDEPGRQFVAQLVEQQRQHGLTILATNDQRDAAWADLVLTVGAAARG
ncbi:MAG TPA: transcriptional regulator [Herpetosiphon sp.]|nr:ABC transporter ATP-binding protein [Herpetosiphon sp.]HBW51035.1 transcriptional regulator [Herpetosiphon sp.]